MAMRAEIGRVGNGAIVAYPVAEGSTVRELIEQAGLTIAGNEKVVDSDTTVVALTDKVEDGETYYLVGAYKSG